MLVCRLVCSSKQAMAQTTTSQALFYDNGWILRIQGKLAAKFPNRCFRLHNDGFIGSVFQNGNNQIRHDIHLFFRHSPGSQHRRADPDTAGDQRSLRIVGDGVFIQRQAGPLQNRFSFLAGNTEAA